MSILLMYLFVCLFLKATNQIIFNGVKVCQWQNIKNKYTSINNVSDLDYKTWIYVWNSSKCCSPTTSSKCTVLSEKQSKSQRYFTII